MAEKYYAKGTMNTEDGVIYGVVQYNPHWKKYQVVIDGVTYEEFKNPDDAVDNLKGAGFKNVKIMDGSTLKEVPKKKFNASDISHTYDMIAKRTATNPNKVKEFIESNNLDATSVMMAVGQNSDPKFDLVTAMVGKPNNVYFKYIVNKFAKKTNESVKKELTNRIASKVKQRLKSLVENSLNENPDRNLLNKQINTAYKKLVAICEDEVDTLESVAQIQVYTRVAEFLQKRALYIKQNS